MVNQNTRIVLIVSLLIAGLQIFGFFSPMSLTWGFHFLGFLSGYEAAIYCLLAAGCIIYAMKGNIEQHIHVLARAMERRPAFFLILSILIFICIASVFRVTTPLLGDGFFLVKNFSDALHDTAPILYRNEPLATYYFWVIVRLYGVSTYAAFLKGFFFGELLLGAGFIVVIFFLVRICFTDRKFACIAFVMLLIPAYMQLFFGYIETYSVVLFVLSGFILAVMLYHRHRIPFSIIPAAFLLLALVHYLTLLLFPALLYLTYCEYRERGVKHIVIGFATTSVIFLLLLMMVNFDFDKFHAEVPHHHYLSLTTDVNSFDADSQAYTLFSLFHFVDIFNYFILMAPMTIVLIVIATIRSRRQFLVNNPMKKFLVVAAVPVFIFLFLVKFDLGMAKDWDVFSPYFFLLTLYGLSLISDGMDGTTMRICVLVLLMTLLSSFVYFHFNTTRDGALKRYTTLFDKRILAHSARYTASLHLAQYYHQANDDRGAIETWRQFILAYPNDGRGYLNVITNMEPSRNRQVDTITAMYERWYTVAPEDTMMNVKFTSFCIDAGNEYFSAGSLDKARAYYTRAIALTPGYANAYNNLGSVYAQMGKLDSAVVLFERAVTLDPAYGEALYNLATAYSDKGKSRQAQEYYRKAAELHIPAAERMFKDSSRSR